MRQMITFVPKYVVFAVILSLFASACASSKKNSDNQSEDIYKQLAEEKYQDNIEYSRSPNGGFMLVIKDIKGTSQQPRNDLRFFVYDLKNQKITFELRVGMGVVKWMDENHLEVFRTPTVVREGYERDDFITVYNALDGSSRPKKAK